MYEDNLAADHTCFLVVLNIVALVRCHTWIVGVGERRGSWRWVQVGNQNYPLARFAVHSSPVPRCFDLPCSLFSLLGPGGLPRSQRSSWRGKQAHDPRSKQRRRRFSKSCHPRRCRAQGRMHFRLPCGKSLQGGLEVDSPRVTGFSVSSLEAKPALLLSSPLELDSPFLAGFLVSSRWDRIAANCSLISGSQFPPLPPPD